MSSAAAQYRNEKKRMEEAVARVREVVHSASKNDIILALHNFDLDVNRTIQAFCDDGAQSALDSWERTGSGSSKKKAQKKKKTSAAPVTSTQAAPSKQQSMPTTASNGHIDFNDRSSPMANGDMKAAPAAVPSSVSAALEDIQSSAAKQKEPLTPSQPSNSPPIANLHILNDDQKTKVLSTEISSLKSYGAEIGKIETAFENELALAEENVRGVFKGIRQLLADRESHLLAELKRAREDGARVLNERRVQACELYERGLRIAAMSEREQAELHEEMTTFAAQTAAERENAHTSRFLYDNAQLIKLVKNFGQVVGVKGLLSGGSSATVTTTAQQQAAFAIKHSTSHSSIVSSLGEDSGLGHISPVANEKHVVEVSNGGICMKSDALSADELADLNKKLQETLKAQGIDESVLSGIGSGTMPVRRRPAGPRGGSGRGGGAARRGQAARMPQLSILQS
ncbi:Spermatogenesis-associated serine-rich protein 2 [Toxocara canis]|uniref:Spermatogenesis-associated serine-rich protein 2 n=1 Tax=Toxocara canis TaxID=6265 RepID=A0A0B2VKE0_TOXCA|nr:Spermatogenesis-associated serine-rich protein 2 [Toxocara canis]